MRRRTDVTGLDEEHLMPAQQNTRTAASAPARRATRVRPQVRWSAQRTADGMTLSALWSAPVTVPPQAAALQPYTTHLAAA